MNQPYYKKLNCLLAVLLLFTAFAIYSCQKDTSETQEPADALLSARTWYEQTFPVKTGNANLKTLNLNTIGESTNGDFSQIVKPDWNHASIYNRFGKQVIEMPLDSAVMLGIVPQNTATVKNEYDFNKSYSKSSFLLLNDSKGGYEAYIMTLIADSAWVGGDFTKLKNQTYNHKANDFGGRLLYFTPKGKLVNGYRYVNGRITGVMTSSAAITSKAQISSFLAQQAKKLTETVCSVSSYSVYAGTTCALGYCSTHYSVHTTITCHEQTRANEDDGGGGFTPPGNGGNGTTTTTVEQVEVVEKIINTDSLKAKFPCAVKLILDKLLNQQNYTDFVAAFQTPQKPTLTWNSANLEWNKSDGNGAYIYKLGQEVASPSSFNGLSRDITLNNSMLVNSSKLLIAVTAIHETLHAYIGYNMAIDSYNSNNYKDYGTWSGALYAFYSIKGLYPNYSGHYQMLIDYFDKAVNILATWDNNQHTQKEYTTLMLYGLRTTDPNTPVEMKARIDSVYNFKMASKGISQHYLDSLTRVNLNATTGSKLPTSGCN